MSLELESGELMGMGPDTAGVDFGGVDFRLSKAGFIRPDHYDFYYPNYASPLDYFRSDLRSTLAAGLVSDYVEPLQPIMAVGNSISGMSVGSYSFNVEAGGLVNRAFRDVRPDGNTYCYDRFLQGQSIGGLPLGKPNGVVLMSMPTETTLKIQLVTGSLCVGGQVLTASATTFER